METAGRLGTDWLLDAEAFGVRPRAFHVSSVLFHIANSVLLLWALVRLTGSFWPSAFTAGVFALHPLHVESVAWASARKDVLAGLFAGGCWLGVCIAVVAR